MNETAFMISFAFIITIGLSIIFSLLDITFGKGKEITLG